MNFKYTNSEHKVVYRINADGSCESHLVEAKIIQDWLLEKDEQGNLKNHIDLED